MKLTLLIITGIIIITITIKIIKQIPQIIKLIIKTGIKTLQISVITLGIIITILTIKNIIK